MINYLLMDLRRLFKTRSFYITCLIALGLLGIMATASWFLADQLSREMGGTAAMMPGGQMLKEARRLFNLSRFASFFMGAPSLLHLLLVVFAAGFISKDHHTGYLKNLLAVRDARTKWLASKLLSMLVAGALFYLVVIAGSAVATVLFGNRLIVDAAQLGAFFGLHLTADLALFALLCLTSAFFQTKTAAVMAGMIVSFNMQALLYLLIDQIGFLPFKLQRYGMMGMAGKLDIFSFGQAQPDMAQSVMSAMSGGAGAATTAGQLLPISLGLLVVFTLLAWLTLRLRDYKG